MVDLLGQRGGRAVSVFGPIGHRLEADRFQRRAGPGSSPVSAAGIRPAGPGRAAPSRRTRRNRTGLGRSAGYRASPRGCRRRWRARADRRGLQPARGSCRPASRTPSPPPSRSSWRARSAARSRSPGLPHGRSRASTSHSSRGSGRSSRSASAPPGPCRGSELASGFVLAGSPGPRSSTLARPQFDHQRLVERSEQDVGRLQVAMEHAPAVRVGDRLADVNESVEQVPQAPASARGGRVAAPRRPDETDRSLPRS